MGWGPSVQWVDTLRTLLAGRRGLVGFAAGLAMTGLAMPAVIVAGGITDSEPTGASRADAVSGSADPAPAGQAVSSVSDWSVPVRRTSSSSGGFMTPTGIAVDLRGVTLMTLADDDRIWVLRNDGSPASPWDTSTAGTSFRRPSSVSFSPTGTVLVADTGNHRIVHLSGVEAPRVIAVLGGRTSGTGAGMFARPSEAAADEAGQVIVADTGNHRIQMVDRDGRSIAVWGRTIRGEPKRGTSVGEFASPRGVAVGRDGRIVVADTGNNRVQSHAPLARPLNRSTGWDVWPVPVLDDPLRIGNYRMPAGIAVDPMGRTLIADSGNHRIVIRNANANANANARTWESWGGRAGTAPGEFVMPMAISVGPGGRVEVADTGNDRIQIATLRPSTSA